MAGRAPLSFRTRLTVRWTVVFSCVLAAASVAIYLGIRSASYADLDRHLRTLAGTEVASAFDQPISPHLHELPTTILAGGTFTEKLVQVFGVDGQLIVSSRGRGENPQLVARDVIDAGLAGDAPVATIYGDGVPIRVLALRNTHNGTDYVFVVGVVIEAFISSLARVKWLLVMVWLVSTGATAAVGFALASTALEPVRHITQRAMHIAAADIRARLEAPTIDDEIGQMARSLNVLLERLQGAIDANRRFAADAAHELRTPVTAMAGEIDVSLRRERTAAEYRDTLALVRDRLTSLSAVINDLMLLVRAQESHGTIARQELSLQAVVNSAVGRLDAMAHARGVSVSTQDLAGLWIYGDAGLLGRVFDNVLENAIRYNRENGTVRIGATFADSAADSWEPGRVIVRISDTGSGIPAGDIDRVFERFYRVDASRNRHTGGAGLGLAIAREVLAVFQGSIHIESSSAEGTTVVLSLPGQQHGERKARGQSVDSTNAGERMTAHMKDSRRCAAYVLVAGLLMLGSAGCGGANEPAATAPGSASGQASAPAPSARSSAELTSDTLDAYERGLTREIEAVRAAHERAGSAQTPQERGEATQASFEHATIPLGAAAAGLPVDDYRELREIINGIFRTLDFQGKIEGPLSIDLSRADAATKERLARNPFDDLSSESAAALRARMDRLVPVWVEYIGLTAVAG